MSATNRLCKVPIKFLLWGLIAICWLFIVPKVSAQTYDFDEGIEEVTKGLISGNRETLKNKKIAVFGIIESRSGKKWEISSHIEDGIVDALVNNGYRVIERRRIQDVIKKEIKKVTDLWFDQARVAQFGKLVGADIVVTGRYVLWGQGMLKISIRAINVADGEIVAANKVKIHTDRIADLLKPEEKKKHLKEAKVSPKEPVVEPATEERKTTLAVNANVPEAKVLVDGREIGRTPLSDATVSPGEHRIRVEKSGYEPYRKRIRINEGRSMSLYVDLSVAQPRNGRLYVETEPEGARVTILNIRPRFHQGMELTPGRYHVEVFSDGYETKKMWIKLEAGKDETLRFSLKAKSLESPLIGTWSGQYTELRKDGKGKIRWFPITVTIWKDAGKFQADDGSRIMECDGSETSIQCHYKMGAKRGGTYTFSIGSNPNILSASETHYGSKIFDTVKYRDMRKKGKED